MTFPLLLLVLAFFFASYAFVVVPPLSRAWRYSKTNMDVDLSLHIQGRAKILPQLHTLEMVLKSDGENEGAAENNIPDIKKVIHSDDSFDEVGDDDWGDQTEEEFQEYLKEVFEILTTEGGTKNLSLSSFLTWEECEDMIADEFFTEEEVREIWVRVVGGSDKLADFSTFLEVNKSIDESV